MTDGEFLNNGGDAVVLYPSHANARVGLWMLRVLHDTNNGNGLTAGGTAGAIVNLNIKDGWFSNNGKYGFYISTGLWLPVFHGNRSIGHTGGKDYSMGTASDAPVVNYDNF